MQAALPTGWTEHTGPNGVRYYFNGNTQESTYVRPMGPPPESKKKEKPSTKVPIPGTEWLRVRTNEGNTFYFHSVKKQSVWTVPPEIQDAVKALEQQEAAKPANDAEEEIRRVKAEVEALVKRKADDDTDKRSSKKPKIEESESESSDEDDADAEKEDWEKEAEEQLAAEAERAAQQQRDEERARKRQQKADDQALQRKKAELNIPEKADLSIDEAKALFKTLLREKDINPLLPWDTSLPLFVSDPRYVLLPSVTVRRDTFDDYCRERARELRAANTQKEKETLDPKAEYERLLSTEVKSTRTSWTEFRRQWKKDRRFYGWGRDDREREKKFRDYLKELGEKKRAASQKAEADFFALLKQSNIPADGEWKEIKRSISKDPRYDAVGSSTLREELFNTFRKAQNGNSELSTTTASNASQAPPSEGAKESAVARKERALREREEKIKAERARMDATIDKSRNELSKEESERAFTTMLTDAIREPQMTWDEALPQLQTDPRFTNSVLPLNQQVHLFHSHVGRLRERHLNSLHAMFESYASSLASKFESLPLESFRSSLPVAKLGFGTKMLEQEFDKWQRERTTVARRAFDDMLQENSFIEFWGRLNKIGGEGVEGGVKLDDTGMAEDEGEGGGGKVDMKALAKSVDVGEVEKVLKNDKRYIVFDHVPEQREKWLRDYLSNLSAPKLSVHVNN